jgi:hypothetical protein
MSFPLSSVAGAVLLALSQFLSAAEPAPVSTTPEAPGPEVLLKLDDLIRSSPDPKAGPGARWQRVTDFLTAEGVKANYGILAWSLEGDCPTYVAWLQNLHNSGMIEIWDHGYGKFDPPANPGEKRGEFLNRSLEEQTASARTSFDLVKEKTGIVMRAFGPHGTPPDANMHRALATIPEIKLVFFYGPTKGVACDKIVLERRAELEKPIFKPNPNNLRDHWDQYGKRDYLALQGHPNTWDDQAFANFQEAVRFLKQQRCRFLTVSDYLAAHPPVSAPPPTP